MIKTKYWITALVALLMVSAIGAVFAAQQKTDSTTAKVTVDGTLVQTISLSPDMEKQTFTVTGTHGLCTIVAENGEIRMENADCPDHLCVKQGAISDSTIPIVCLPNRVVIRLEADRSSTIITDSFTR